MSEEGQDLRQRLKAFRPDSRPVSLEKLRELGRLATEERWTSERIREALGILYAQPAAKYEHRG